MVTGWFKWAGHHDPHPEVPGTPGVMEWSREAGATVRLVGPTPGWPERLVTEGMVINGVTSEGAELSLVDAWISRMHEHPARVVSLRSSTLLVGEQLTGDERWDSATYRTADLHEWLPETGLLPREYGEQEMKWPPERVTIAWEPPSPYVVQLPVGELSLSHGQSSPYRWGPEISIKTWMSAHVRPNEPTSADDLWRRFAAPLLCLTALASGRSDNVTFERLRNADDERTIDLLRQGDDLRPTRWMDGRWWLFDARDLDDVPRAVARWYELYEASFPAISIFAQSLEHENHYPGARLVEVSTALEGYAKNAKHIPKASGMKRLKNLREYADVPVEVSGWTNHNLGLIHASRNYYVHPDLG